MHVIKLIITLFLTHTLAESDSCTTYKGTRGSCVNIKQCPFLLNLLKHRKLLPKNYALQRLSKSQCGFERLDPKVCCSSELTDGSNVSLILTAELSEEKIVDEGVKKPREFGIIGCKTANMKLEGKCVSVNECPSLYAVLNRGTASMQDEDKLKVLKDSLCGWEKMSPKVCCEDKLLSSSIPGESVKEHQVVPDNAKRVEHCVTQRGVNGACVNIKNCKQVFGLLKQLDNSPYEVSKRLKDLHCGFDNMEPKVCCEESSMSTPTITDHQSKIPTPPDVTNHPNLGLLDHEICGPISEARIIGGSETAVFEFPWMALIAYDTGSGGPPEFRCGGTLVTKKHVLTAAHCVTSLPVELKLFGVRLGEHDLSSEKDCDAYGEEEDEFEVNCAAGYQDFSIIGVAVHPDYPKEKLQDDIGLIMLEGEADFRSANVRPICLPISRTLMLDSKMVVTGWGATESGPRSQTLRKVTLPIVPHEECARLYKMRNINICHKQICAGGSNRADSCSGDSGGPLQTLGIYNRQPRNILYGVVSFGPRDCGVEGIPGVYTRIEYYMDWILDTIGTEMYDE